MYWKNFTKFTSWFTYYNLTRTQLKQYKRDVITLQDTFHCVLYLIHQINQKSLIRMALNTCKDKNEAAYLPLCWSTPSTQKNLTGSYLALKQVWLRSQGSR